MMLMGSFSLAAAWIVATTQAAPPMSPRISSIAAAGLMLIPPESNVIPLPNNNTLFRLLIFYKIYHIKTSIFEKINK